MNAKEKFWEKYANRTPELLDLMSTMEPNSYVAITDIETGITWWSKQARELFNYEECVHYSAMRPNLRLHPDDAADYRQNWQDRMEGKHLGETFEYRILFNDVYMLFSTKNDMLTDENGKPLALISIIHNLGVPNDVDMITGLPNDLAFTRDINEAVNKNRQVTVLKVGIAKFSNINIMYGAKYANTVLFEVGHRLAQLACGQGKVYRLTGSKFGLIFPSLDRKQLAALYNRIQDYFSNQFVVEKENVPLRLSGGAMILDHYFGDAIAIKSRLTYAINHSKHAHHGELVIFNDEICGLGNDQLELISIIHQSAVSGFDGFYLCYQPITSAKTQKISGMEALLRWRKEPFGVVPPGIFIEWLEEDPCIYGLGNWIMRQAIYDACKIQKYQQDFFVNVNVSVGQIERKEFRQSVLDILEETGFPPNQLCIELTERCRELDVEFLRQEVIFFRSHGIRIAMDDFGTGSASLQLALELPVDELKIDMSFIKDIQNKPTNQAMVKSIVDFGRSSHLDICIEGVEDQSVLDYISQYGATWYQGYFFSKPVIFEDLEDLIEKQYLEEFQAAKKELETP